MGIGLTAGWVLGLGLKTGVSWVLKIQQTEANRFQSIILGNLYLIIYKSYYFWKVTTFGRCSHIITLYIIGYDNISWKPCQPHDTLPKSRGRDPNPRVEVYGSYSPTEASQRKSEPKLSASQSQHSNQSYPRIIFFLVLIISVFILLALIGLYLLLLWIRVIRNSFHTNVDLYLIVNLFIMCGVRGPRLIDNALAWSLGFDSRSPSWVG